MRCRSARPPTAVSAINQLSTHLHNGHNPGESDGYPGAYFFPGQYYDYRYPFVLSGHDRVEYRSTTGETIIYPDGYGGDTSTSQGD